MMKLTKEQALFYHRQMWGDMRLDLGDCPTNGRYYYMPIPQLLALPEREK